MGITGVTIWLLGVVALWISTPDPKLEILIPKFLT